MINFYWPWNASKISVLFFLKVCPFIVRLLCPTNRRRKELTMRIFPMPLSGEKRKWKKIGERCCYYCRVELSKGGEKEGLVNRQFFPRPILSWNSSWEFRFCQPNKPTNIVVYYTLGFSIWNDRRILFIHTKLYQFWIYF